MVQVLYNGLLNGSDPRRVLNDLRRQLKSRVPLTHDWASIVAYASLPENLTDELSSFRIQQAKGSIEAALDHADTLTREGLNRSYQGTGSGTGDASVPPLNATFEALEEPERRLKRAQQRLEELLLHHSYPEEASIYGLLASTQKRLAEVLWRMAVKNTDRLMYYRPQALTALRASRDFYGKAFQADGAQSWALVQQLALIAVLQGADQISPDDWQIGRLLSLRDLTIENRERRTWAQANLIELYLLALMRSDTVLVSREKAEQKVREHLKQFLQVVDLHTWSIRSTSGQLFRYLEFFIYVQPQVSKISGLVEEVLSTLGRTISNI